MRVRPLETCPACGRPVETTGDWYRHTVEPEVGCVLISPSAPEPDPPPPIIDRPRHTPT